MSLESIPDIPPTSRSPDRTPGHGSAGRHGRNHQDPGLRFRAVHQISRLLPPLLAPRFSALFYPFERARRERKEPWVESITGARARWPLDDIHGYHLALNSYHDWRLLACAKAVTKPGDTIIEVGANIGTETVGLSAIAGRAGRVIAIEPLPANTALLKRVLYDANIKNVTLLTAAASDREGPRAFVIPEQHMSGTGHLNPDEKSAEESEGVIEVDAITLNKVRQNMALHPALIVTDVEGAELSVLRGALQIILYDRPSIIVEACGRHAIRGGSSLQELQEELRNWGYSIRAIGRYGLGDARTEADAPPCNWIAVPTERKSLFRQISLNLVRSGMMPPSRYLNPLAVRH